MLLLGIAGRAGVGKDTVADRLVNAHEFVKFGMAWPLKAMLEVGLGLSPADFQSGPQKEAIIPHLGFSYRQAAQTLGTEWGRGLNPNLWLLIAKQRIEYTRDSLKVRGMVCCDVRFDNEAEMIRGLGGLIVHMSSTKLNPVTVGAAAHHVSEKGIAHSPDDAYIDNSGSIERLYQMVDWMAKDLQAIPE